MSIRSLFAMACFLGATTPLSAASRRRRRSAYSTATHIYEATTSSEEPAPPVERVKSQRELDAEAKRVRRRERNLRNAAKMTPTKTGNYFVGIDPGSERGSKSVVHHVEDLPEQPPKVTPNTLRLLEYLRRHDGVASASSLVPSVFSSTNSCSASVAAAQRAGLVTRNDGLVSLTKLGWQAALK